MGEKHTLCPSCGSVQYDKAILKACAPWESVPQNTLCNSDILISIRICKSCGTMYVDNAVENAKDCLKKHPRCIIRGTNIIHRRVEGE